MRATLSCRVAALLLLLCTSGCQRSSVERLTPKSLPPLRLLHTWGIEESATAQMQLALAGSLNDIPVELNRADSSINALVRLRRGEVDAIFTVASLAYMASTGELAEIAEPSDDFRAIAELPTRPVLVVVGARSTITSVSGLRGRHVSIGPAGSKGSMALVAEPLLRAFGISLRDVRAERFEPIDGVRRVVSGELDAAFWFGPSHPEVDQAVRRGARIVEISKTEVDQARANYPLLKPTTVNGGRYSTIDYTIHTVGVDEILLCRKDLDERLAHKLTRAFVEIVAGRNLDIEPLTNMNLSAASSTAIPLHPGAARYYRERELLP